MRITIPFLILIFLFPAIPAAQQVEISGYYEPEYIGVFVNDGSASTFSNKLRVDFQSDQYDNVQFAANFDFIKYTGMKTWNLLFFVPDSIANTVHSTLWDFFRFTYRDTILLDNAYARINLPRFDLTIGRQQISLGTGYVWNPTDLFNYKSIADPTYEQPGHDVIRVDVPLSLNYNLMALYGPEKDWDSSTKLVRLKGRLGHFDLSAIYIDIIEKTAFLRQGAVFGYYYTSSDNRRRLFGGDIVGELLGLGVWGEFGYNRIDNENNFSEIDIGFDYTLDNGTYILSEYYHNERAKSDYKELELNDWLRYLTAGIKTITRDNLYLYVDYPLTDLIHINNSLVGSLNDYSFALIPGANYSFQENIELQLFINLSLGEDLKSYTSEQGQSGLLRMRIYF
jgi:hypothetical protein